MSSFRVHVPPKFELLVKQGDFVKPGQTLAKISLNEEFTAGSITLYSLLEVKPKDVKKYLVKADGDVITRGELIARRRGLFSSIRVKSPANGILRVAKERDGVVSIEPRASDSIKSPVRGNVVKATEKVGIIIDTKSTVFVGMAGKRNATGKLFKIANDGNIFSINRRVAGNIVFGDNIDEAGVSKIKALGGRGFAVNNNFDIKDASYIVIEDVVKLDEYVGKKAKIVNNGGHYLIING